jgi:hypothetical protein
LFVIMLPWARFACCIFVTPEFPEIQSARYVFHHNPRIIIVIHIT